VIHTGAGVAVAAHALAACVWVSRKSPSSASATGMAASLLAAFAIIVALAALCLPAIRRRGAERRSRAESVVLRMPLALGVVALALAVVAAWNVEAPPNPPRSPFVTMPGLDATIRVTYLLVFLALLVLIVVAGWQAGRTGRLDRAADSTVWYGLAAPVFAGTAWVVAMAYSVTVLFGAQRLMDRGAPGQPEYAVMMQWSAVGLLVGTGISLLGAAVALIEMMRIRRAETDEFRRVRGRPA
jgi:hypothetical protein